MRFLRVRDVSQKMGLSRASIYKLVQRGLFPRPVKVFAKVSVWPDTEVDQIMSAMCRQASSSEIRDLVRRLEEQRRGVSV